jgi:hypothetical protein
MRIRHQSGDGAELVRYTSMEFRGKAKMQVKIWNLSQYPGGHLAMVPSETLQGWLSFKEASLIKNLLCA